MVAESAYEIKTIIVGSLLKNFCGGGKAQVWV